MTGDGWDDSAAAWIAAQGEHGDFGRRYVLDGPMLARVRGRGFHNALDVGCGEGRFCRLLQREGVATIGIDPTVALVERARALDPEGDYRVARAEAPPVPAGSVDLVVSYLSLVDIEPLDEAVAQMFAALRVGGSLLVANMNGFHTAGAPSYWFDRGDGEPRFWIDRYLQERAVEARWAGIQIRNWHRPLSTYMRAFLAHGLVLRHFDEPAPTGGEPRKVASYERVPYFHVMEWQKA